MADMTMLYVVVNVLLGALGWFIQQRLSTIKMDLDEIKRQVYITNGRISRLEEWKIGHERSNDSVHARLSRDIEKLESSNNHIKER